MTGRTPLAAGRVIRYWTGMQWVEYLAFDDAVIRVTAPGHVVSGIGMLMTVISLGERGSSGPDRGEYG